MAAMIRHIFDPRSGFGSERAPSDLSTEVRILFEGAFATFPLPCNATFADLAERVFKLDAYGEPRRIELLVRRRHGVSQPQPLPPQAA